MTLWLVEQVDRFSDFIGIDMPKWYYKVRMRIIVGHFSKKNGEV